MNEIELTANATGSLSKSGDMQIPIAEKPILVSIGPVPVVFVVSATLNLGYEVDIESQSSITAGVSASSVIELGVDFSQTGDA